MKLKKGYSLYWHEPVGETCGSGGHVRVDLLHRGKLVQEYDTCICGRGCGNRDCVVDDWGSHDTVLEAYRTDDMQEKFLITFEQEGEPCADFLTAQDAAMLIGMADIYDADFFRVFRVVDGVPEEVEFCVHHGLQTVDLFDDRGNLIGSGYYFEH